MEPNHTSVCVRRADTTLRAADGDQAGGWYRGSRLSTEYDSLSLKPCEFNFSQKKKKKIQNGNTNLQILTLSHLQKKLSVQFRTVTSFIPLDVKLYIFYWKIRGFFEFCTV